MTLVFATRSSALARWQTRWVMDTLQKAHPGLVCEEKIITTRGDKILDKPLPEIGGKGLFTQELEAELLSGAVHCAVHSLKDLPVENPAGLTVGAIPARAEARDTLVSGKGYTLSTLPKGAVVGTSSLRRAAQVLRARPDVTIAPLRGNVDARLRKVGVGLSVGVGLRPTPTDGQYDAIILAGAGLIRLGLEEYVTEWLPLDVMLPAPGQGALAVQCRASDQATLGLLAALEDESTRKAVSAERAFLGGLGGGCAVPVAAYAEQMTGEQRLEISLTGLVISPDGEKAIQVASQGADPLQLGHHLAQQAIAQGANDILKPVTEH
jgi:hydroxymethylbilane synthase